MTSTTDVRSMTSCPDASDTVMSSSGSGCHASKMLTITSLGMNPSSVSAPKATSPPFQKVESLKSTVKSPTPSTNNSSKPMYSNSCSNLPAISPELLLITPIPTWWKNSSTLNALLSLIKSATS